MPRKKFYGPQTSKAINNFPISGWNMPKDFICALAMIKEHAAHVNGELKQIPRSQAIKIAKAASMIKSGKHMDQFPIDIFQTGSGTSTNMNINEVIAGLVNEDGRGSRGDRSAEVHPNDHVNRCQSSNDVIPTAMQIACALKVRDELVPALEHLTSALKKKAKEFHSIIKTGRTHHMDAVPVRLGDEFASYAILIQSALDRVKDASKLLNVLPLGGTAAGTGLNAHPRFAKLVIARLAKETKLPLEEAHNHIAAQSFPFASQALSSSLREVAVVLNKIANDIRLMASGPVAGLGELILPLLQPGSSIMPGKVNPVIPESVIQVCADVIGSDVTIGICVSQGSVFELNTCMPLISQRLLTSIRLLANVSNVFADKCISGIKANKKVIEDRIARNSMLVTALAPKIGYDKATEIAKEAMRTGETIIAVAAKRTSINKAELKKILNANNMT